MGLHDLVHDGQTESGSAFELRLEWLEYFLDDLRAHAGTGIGEADLPVFARPHSRRLVKRSALLHGADGVFAEVPEHLFDLVAVCQPQASVTQ